MEYNIIKIDDANKKAEYTNTILRKLPEWFGIEESIAEYVNTVYKYPFWAAFDKDNCIGFFSGKIHYNRTGDIYVCGIDPAYHGKGIGTLLYTELEKYCIQNNCKYRASCKTRLVLHRLLQFLGLWPTKHAFFSGCSCKTEVLQLPLYNSKNIERNRSR